MYRLSSFSRIPDVVRNLLIINCLLFLATYGPGFFSSSFQVDYLTDYLALYSFSSPDFKPYQLITHIFMHGGLGHLFFNMFALWMFGSILENMWGGKKFLIFYMITGLGAAILHLGIIEYEILNLQAKLTSEQLNIIIDKGGFYLSNNQNFTNPVMSKLNLLMHTSMVGASGAIFGLLLAFGMLFPNTELRIVVSLLLLIILVYILPLIPFMGGVASWVSHNLLWIFLFLMIIARSNAKFAQDIWRTIPIKAKHFVIIYGGIELLFGVLGIFNNGPSGNIAHFAHLGGMLFGFLLIKYWEKENSSLY